MMTVGGWGGAGEWVEVWGVELYRPGIFIFIYNSETPPRLQGVDVETLGCNGMRLLRWVGVGREGGRGGEF